VGVELKRARRGARRRVKLVEPPPDFDPL